MLIFPVRSVDFPSSVTGKVPPGPLTEMSVMYSFSASRPVRSPGVKPTSPRLVPKKSCPLEVEQADP